MTNDEKTIVDDLRAISNPRCRCFGCVAVRKAADLIDHQTQALRIADDALKVKDGLLDTLRAENDDLKKDRPCVK